MIATDLLSVEGIRRGLQAATVGRQLYLFGEVESTNVALRRLAREGAVEGTAVLAEAQRAGRGRLGRQWFSPSGVNLYASVLFRPRFAPRQAPCFSFIASLAAADAVKELGPSPAIKWPNDVLVERKKVAGSLVECVTRGDEIECLILGVGINVNVPLPVLRAALGPAGANATSLAAVLGREVDRNALAASYLTHLDAWARRHQAEGAEPIVAAWRERDILTGRRVEIRGEGEHFEGRAVGVDGDGHLLVDDPHGRRHLVLTEEVRILE
ncbi:MAG: biotin--[acetyl-CoA-carboxylase] ligase [Candidatus Rokubacteria bacterium]|nr:biotin--[acetyl-CoA-carboxylase] ligase [Candidatus Rokubacteria bacterium]